MDNATDVCCNVCGRTLRKENDIVVEDFLYIEKNWGYFSSKDGCTHKLVICEKCYDKSIETFLVPVKVTDTTEMI